MKTIFNALLTGGTIGGVRFTGPTIQGNYFIVTASGVTRRANKFELESIRSEFNRLISQLKVKV